MIAASPRNPPPPNTAEYDPATSSDAGPSVRFGAVPDHFEAEVLAVGPLVKDVTPGARVLVRDSETDMFREGSAEAYARGVTDGRGAAGSAGAAAVDPGEAEHVAREAGYADGYRDGFAEGFREGTGNPQQG